MRNTVLFIIKNKRLGFVRNTVLFIQRHKLTKIYIRKKQSAQLEDICALKGPTGQNRLPTSPSMSTVDWSPISLSPFYTCATPSVP